MKKFKNEEIDICMEILNEIAMNGVNLRQAELLVILRNTFNQESELKEEKEKTDGIQ